ncbi:MAG TPA: class I mannose-6-phosphate isomerase [Candidatus Acidoferrales bacterium]|nr:class I mannose-6-phosphate isomerase [Candidatus Acidoferrales bacterium]
MVRNSNYDKHPCVPVSATASQCWVGWREILERLRATLAESRCVLCIECYPGSFELAIREAFDEGLRPAELIYAPELLKPLSAVDDMLREVLGDDPVFGHMNDINLRAFFDQTKLAIARARVAAWNEGLLLVVGVGAAIVSPEPDVLIYADMARWEIQGRQRRSEIANLGANNFDESPSLKYKRAFFVDWRAADRLKKELLPQIDFFLDTNSLTPKLVSGECVREGLRKIARRPFRVVPYFDPGPWGGHWMEEVCDLPHDAPNHAWCFDCVPEENSLLLGLGDVRIELPASDLTFFQPRELLGDAIYSRFGKEFPIRFDFLDTMGGGNLSLQVHPRTEYIRRQFGMVYTQDESYYLLDAGEDGSVYLGVKTGIDREAMICELRAAQDDGPPFRAENYVNRFPARKHDHFLIPAGTIHCSGRNSMVLEISATPYIFTFKLWDWDRLGLNGLPRPIHLDRGLANIAWERDTAWVRKNLINRVESIGSGPGWVEERTGLHELEFIETRRHWFNATTLHDTRGTVNVVNLVEGREATVESPTGAFSPFVVHYVETFVVPAAAGAYTIRPSGESEGAKCATIKAFVRSR